MYSSVFTNPLASKSSVTAGKKGGQADDAATAFASARLGYSMSPRRQVCRPFFDSVQLRPVSMWAALNTKSGWSGEVLQLTFAD